MELPAVPFTPAPRISRFIAFAIDLFLLAILGYAVGVVFFDRVARWGPYGRVFGLAVMTAYLSVGASVLMRGRTIGKRVCGLELRRIGGDYLPIGRAVGRAAMISVPYLVNGWGPKELIQAPTAALALGIGAVVVGGSIVYLFLFNRGTGQSLHDLVFGSVVVRAATATPSHLPPPARIHRLALAGLGVLCGGVMVVGSTFQSAVTTKLAREQALWTRLNGDPRFFTVSVNYNTFFDSGRPTTTVVVQVWLKDLRADGGAVARGLVATALGHYQGNEPDNLTIVITRAYDLGIASWTFNEFDGASTAEWKQRLGTP